MFKLCVCYEPEDNHFVSENYVALFPEICDRITVYNGKILQLTVVFWIGNDPIVPFGSLPKIHPNLGTQSSLVAVMLVTD